MEYGRTSSRYLGIQGIVNNRYQTSVRYVPIRASMPDGEGVEGARLVGVGQ